MGRAGPFSSTHHRIVDKKPHRVMQLAPLITVTPDKLGCNSMASKIFGHQNFGFIYDNILSGAAPFGLFDTGFSIYSVP